MKILKGKTYCLCNAIIISKIGKKKKNKDRKE